MALAIYIPFPEDDSNSTNHNLVSVLRLAFVLMCARHLPLYRSWQLAFWMVETYSYVCDVSMEALQQFFVGFFFFLTCILKFILNESI